MKPVLLVLAICLGGSAALPLAQAALPTHDSQGTALPSLAPMLENVVPGVVNIATSGRVQIEQSPLFDDPFFRRFFDIPQQPREKRFSSLGSGVIIDAAKGLIITNHHVIDKADTITVMLNDGRHFKAKLLGSDPETDVALIKIHAEKLTALPFADSDKLRVGDFVVAIGSPFGLRQTVTSGIVSALGRSGLGIEGYENFIQTDASINPGNSGGALVNLRGELVGINTAIYSQSGGNIGIGFAIPINMVREVSAQLSEHGQVRRGRLGAEAQDLTPELIQAFGLQNGTGGAVITQVTPDSPADKAGLKSGDIVVEINAKPIRDAGDLRNAVGLLRIGQKVELTIVRDGKRKNLEAQIEEPKHVKTTGKALNPHLQGATLGEISEDSPFYGQIEGVMVLAVEHGSPAWRAGLRKNDVITSANRKNVHNLEELRDAVGKTSSLLLNIRRGDSALFLYLQ
ncbi:MAG: DegQ family serine endoprotease [Gammaproteobacteria bacterium]|nr:DegQ family serine endoprotease [Gammaproteobacteria bacterium]